MPNEGSIDITLTVMMRTGKRREKQRRSSGGYDDRGTSYHSKSAHHGSQRARTGFMRRRDDLSSAKTSRTSYEEAMNALFKATKTTQTFLSQFKDDFDHDIRGIKSYAHPDLINELWYNKIESSDRHDHTVRTGSQDQEPQLRDVARGFFRSLKLAISSTNPRSDPAVARKLHHASDDMGQLLQDVAFDFRLINGLMTVLEMLTVFLERNGADTGSRGDKNTSEKRQKRPSRRGESGERQQSRRGSDSHQHSDDGRGESGSEGRSSIDGSETDDRERDHEGQPDTEDRDDE